MTTAGIAGGLIDEVQKTLQQAIALLDVAKGYHRNGMLAARTAATAAEYVITASEALQRAVADTVRGQVDRAEGGS